MLLEIDRRTPPQARVLLVLPHTPWQATYGYGFRRVQTSWDRILRQIMPLIALIAVFPSVVVIASAWRRRNATEP